MEKEEKETYMQQRIIFDNFIDHQSIYLYNLLKQKNIKNVAKSAVCYLSETIKNNSRRIGQA